MKRALSLTGIAGLLLAAMASVASGAASAAATPGPSGRVATIPVQARNLAAASASKGNVIKPSMALAGIPVFHVTSPGTLAGIHACLSLGTDGTNQGVECADLFAEPDGRGGVLVLPRAEGFCNHGASYPQCANVSILLSVNLGSGQRGTVDNGVCGHSNGNCVNNGRNIFVGVNGFDLTGCSGTGTASEVWTVDWSSSDIELPGSGLNVASTSNLGSGHAIVCP